MIDYGEDQWARDRELEITEEEAREQRRARWINPDPNAQAKGSPATSPNRGKTDRATRETKKDARSQVTREAQRGDTTHNRRGR